MTIQDTSHDRLLAENESLRIRLKEANETMYAIGSGQADAFVASGPNGEQVFRVLVETMNEGAATLDADGTIRFCNTRLAAILQLPPERIKGTRFVSHVATEEQHLFTEWIEKCALETCREEVTMTTGTGDSISTMISCSAAGISGDKHIGLVITDLTPHKRHAEILASEKLARSIIEQAGEAIIVCDKEGRVIRASRLAYQFCAQDLLLNFFDELLPLSIRGAAHPFSITASLRGEGFENVEVEFKQSDDQTFFLLLNANPLRDDLGHIIGCVVTLTDITGRRKAELQLKASLAEKEVLLREVHHRVKNNMAAVIGLFDLQRQTMKDMQSQTILTELASRIRAMSLVHEKLYRSDSLARIDMQDYTQSLTSDLAASFGSPGIHYEVEAQGVMMPLDLAVPCGMIINELIVNALKYAFPEKNSGTEPGRIVVAMGRDHGLITLSVSDNGIGLPPGFDLNTATTLGLSLVFMLGQHQLGGRYEVSRTKGTRVTLTFPLRNRRITYV